MISISDSNDRDDLREQQQQYKEKHQEDLQVIYNRVNHGDDIA
jgi:hypothetical protein